MNKETLDLANKMIAEIAGLKSHLEHVKQYGNGSPIVYNSGTPKVHIDLGDGVQARRLHLKYLPLPLGDLMDLYIKRVEESIAQLESGLEAL